MFHGVVGLVPVLAVGFVFLGRGACLPRCLFSRPSWVRAFVSWRCRFRFLDSYSRFGYVPLGLCIPVALPMLGSVLAVAFVFLVVVLVLIQGFAVL